MGKVKATTAAMLSSIFYISLKKKKIALLPQNGTDDQNLGLWLMDYYASRITCHCTLGLQLQVQGQMHMAWGRSKCFPFSFHSTSVSIVHIAIILPWDTVEKYISILSMQFGPSYHVIVINFVLPHFVCSAFLLFDSIQIISKA